MVFFVWCYKSTNKNSNHNQPINPLHFAEFAACLQVYLMWQTSAPGTSQCMGPQGLHSRVTLWTATEQLPPQRRLVFNTSRTNEGLLIEKFSVNQCCTLECESPFGQKRIVCMQKISALAHAYRCTILTRFHPVIPNITACVGQCHSRRQSKWYYPGSNCVGKPGKRPIAKAIS